MKRLSIQREERENNIIMFNVPEKSNSSDDINFFNEMCSDTLELSNVPNVKIQRVDANNKKYHKPIKVCFEQNWEKRKFLSSLFKLKSVEKYNGIWIKHDMCSDDRAENNKLLKEAHELNAKDNSKDYKYKVRGPPWSMRIVKIFSKN